MIEEEDNELTIPILEFVDAELPDFAEGDINRPTAMGFAAYPPSQSISPQICDQNTKIFALAISMILVGITLIIVATN